MVDRSEGRSSWARFGGFEIDSESGELHRQGRKIRLTHKSFRVLEALLEKPGQLVTRTELRERLWSEDTFVDFDNNLNAAVSRLREALNDSVQGPRFIETVPRKGYRYVGPPPQWDGTDDRAPDTERRRWPVAAFLTVAAASALIATWVATHRDPPKPAGPTDRMLLAVLPFENLSDDPDRGYLADGLTEELLTRLGAMAPNRLGVIARASVRRYKNTDKTVEEVGDELGVDFVVLGSVRTEDERFRVTAQLIHVRDQTHLWASSYDGDALSLLDIQADIALQVARAIRERLLPGLPEPAANLPTENVEAFEAYLEGIVELAKNDFDASRRAAERFERAVLLDPTFAHSWVALAKARNILWFEISPPEDATWMAELARSAAGAALELDPSLTEAHAAIAFSRLYHDWDALGAAETLDPVLAASPHAIEILQLAAAAFSAIGRHDEALEAAAEARVLDPASPSSGSALGWYALFAGRAADAEASCREALDHSPDDAGASKCLYQALLRNGKPAEAIRILGGLLIREGMPRERFKDMDPEHPEEAIPALERLRLEHIFAADDDDAGAPFDAAAAFAALGERDQAFAALEMAYARHDARLLFLAVDVRFDALRADPRLSELIARVEAPR